VRAAAAAEAVLGVHVMPMDTDGDEWLQRPVDMDELMTHTADDTCHGARTQDKHDNMSNSMSNSMINSMSNSMGSSMGSTMMMSSSLVEDGLQELELGASASGTSGGDANNQHHNFAGPEHTPSKNSSQGDKMLRPRKPLQQHGSPACRQPQTSKVVASKSVAHFLETQFNPLQQIRMANNHTDKIPVAAGSSGIVGASETAKVGASVQPMSPQLPPTMPLSSMQMSPTLPPLTLAPKATAPVPRQPRSKRLSMLVQKNQNENQDPNQGVAGLLQGFGKKRGGGSKAPSFLDELRNKAGTRNKEGGGNTRPGAGGFLSELQLAVKSKQLPAPGC
jgi:hypothetical protein